MTANGNAIVLVSFGFLHDDPPVDVQRVVDVRDRLRDRAASGLVIDSTGTDPAVQRIVHSAPGAMDLLTELLAWATQFPLDRPRRLAIGCDGGRHRAPALCEMLAEQLQARGENVAVEHRHIHLPPLLPWRQPDRPGWRVHYPNRHSAGLVHVAEYSLRTEVFRHDNDAIHVVGAHADAQRIRTLLRSSEAWRLHSFDDRQLKLDAVADVLGGRVTHLLRRTGFTTLDEVAQVPATGLQEIHNVGPATLAALAELLATHSVQHPGATS